MRRLMIIAFGLMVGLGLSVTSTWANSWGWQERQVKSVFPQPRDQWKSWGVDNRHGHFHRGGGTTVIIGAPAPTPVWVPAQWWWNGYGWQWVPGYWSY